MRRAVVTGLILGLLAGALATPRAIASDVPSLPVVTLEDVLAWAPDLEVPPDDVGLIVHADFDPDNPYTIGLLSFAAITVDLPPEEEEEEGVITRNAVAGSAADGSGVEAEECQDEAFGTVGKRWGAGALPIEFKINPRTIPSYMNKSTTTKSLLAAYQVWGQTQTKCAEQDTIDFSFDYVGPSGKRMASDGINNTDWGKLGGSTVAFTAVYYKGDTILEADLRMSNAFGWTTRADAAKRYNVKNVAVHEIGHALGLDDLSTPHGSLTMFGVVRKGEVRKASLGKGDVRGAQAIFPGPLP